MLKWPLFYNYYCELKVQERYFKMHKLGSYTNGSPALSSLCKLNKHISIHKLNNTHMHSVDKQAT